MSVKELTFSNKAGEKNLVVTFENDVLSMNLLQLELAYQFDRGEAHMLYLYLKERFEP